MLKTYALFSYAFLDIEITCVAAMGATFFVRGFGYALFYFLEGEKKIMKKILALILALLLVVGTFAACAASTPGNYQPNNEQTENKAESPEANKGEKVDQGDKGDFGRGILKTEIIDGYLWITYTDAPENPIKIGKVSSDAPDTSDETDDFGFDFYPLPDGTYGVKAGRTQYLEKIVIPSAYKGKAVTQILPDAFKEATNLTEIAIPDSVTSIDSFAFECCTSLTSVTIGNSVTSIGNDAFSDCSNLTSITIPNSVTSIGKSAFYNCDSLTSVTIGNGVTSIGSSAFYDSDSLTSVTIIGNGVTEIGYRAFRWCDSLTSVTIGNGVTSIGSEAFYNCSNLTSIKYRGTEEQWGNVSKFYPGNPSSCVITYNYTGA